MSRTSTFGLQEAKQLKAMKVASQCPHLHLSDPASRRWVFGSRSLLLPIPKQCFLSPVKKKDLGDPSAVALSCLVRAASAELRTDLEFP